MLLEEGQLTAELDKLDSFLLMHMGGEIRLVGKEGNLWSSLRIEEINPMLDKKEYSWSVSQSSLGDILPKGSPTEEVICAWSNSSYDDVSSYTEVEAGDAITAIQGALVLADSDWMIEAVFKITWKHILLSILEGKPKLAYHMIRTKFYWFTHK